MEGEGRREEGEVRVPRFEGLALLLDGYFHEDFRTEHGSHENAARAFAREASRVELAAAANALKRLIEWARGVSLDEWQDALVRAGGSWRPCSLVPLSEVLAILRTADGSENRP